MSNLDVFQAPHVGIGWFVYLDLPVGERWLYTGIGTINVSGQEWKGITDPVGCTLGGVGSVGLPKIGVANFTQLFVSGVDEDFYRDVFEQSNDIEGRTAEISLAVVNQETGQFLIKPSRHVKGFVSSPKHLRPNKRIRNISINVENIWFRTNQPFSGKWNNPNQQELFPQDKGLQLVGYSGTETIR